MEFERINPLIVYASNGGNTRRVAQAIASKLKCESVEVTKSKPDVSINLNAHDLIFVGSGIRYGNPNENLVTYLKNAKLDSQKQFALFITWGGAGKTNQDTIAKLKFILESKNQKCLEKHFCCFGGWNILKRGHPSADEIIDAQLWAKNTIQSFSQP